MAKENIIIEKEGLLASSISYIHMHLGIRLSSIYSGYRMLTSLNIGFGKLSHKRCKSSGAILTIV
jgi:hypothetical protein